MADLTTLASVEAFLKLPAGNADEALLATLITSASAFAESYCSRSFLSTGYTETRDGDGGRRLMLRNRPVTAVTSVTVDGEAIPAGGNTSNPGFMLTTSGVTLFGYRFCRGLANVVIEYTGGYSQVPPDVAQAVIELVAYKYKSIPRFGLSSQGIGPQHTSYIITDMPAPVASALNRYLNVVPA